MSVHRLPAAGSVPLYFSQHCELVASLNEPSTQYQPPKDHKEPVDEYYEAPQDGTPQEGSE